MALSNPQKTQVQTVLTAIQTHRDAIATLLAALPGGTASSVIGAAEKAEVLAAWECLQHALAHLDAATKAPATVP